jgi:hypothetical protein
MDVRVERMTMFRAGFAQLSSSLRGAKRRSNPESLQQLGWIASLRSQ